MRASGPKRAAPARQGPPARALAYAILLDVERQRAYASDLLRSRLDADAQSRERALATELVMGTLRWQRLLDFLAERYARRGLSSLDREVLLVLRLGIYQLRFLTRIPARAAVSESVELVKLARKKSAAPLVNAALRRAARERDRPVADFVPQDLATAEKLAVLHSHPTWLVERWLERFGEEQTVALLQADNRTPRQACAFPNPARREDALRLFDRAGIGYRPGRLLRDAIVVDRGNITGTAAFHDGWIGIQDEASQLVPLLLGVKRGQSVLDLCAAPGGKTLMLSALAGRDGRVVAADLHEQRLRALHERLRHARIENTLLVALDGSASLPLAKKFERILVDAPCSGTGTLARHPEIRWRLSAADLGDLHRRQTALLVSALAHLAPGGALLYSTCSLEPEENEAVLGEALAAHPSVQHERLQIPPGVLAAGVSGAGLIDEDGAFRTFPAAHHSDGFFAALVRQG